jgi:hypothetical protein
MASKRDGAKDCEKADVNDDMNKMQKNHFRNERIAGILRR